MLKDYYKFETELLEDSKQNIIAKLWFKTKQLDEMQSKYERLKSTNTRLDVENTALRLALKIFGERTR